MSLQIPSEQILYIASFCTLKSLSAYSKTDYHIRKSCGMLKLNELYKLAMQGFKNLQSNFIFRTDYISIPKDFKNVYVVTLKNFKPQTKENVLLHFDSYTSKKFEPLVAYLIEKNKYFAIEDTIDVLSTLKDDQFIAAVRLGVPISTDVEITEGTNYLRALYNNYINYDNANLIRTTTYPIKEVRCIFDQKYIPKYEIRAIEKAAKNAFESPESFL